MKCCVSCTCENGERVMRACNGCIGRTELAENCIFNRSRFRFRWGYSSKNIYVLMNFKTSSLILAFDPSVLEHKTLKLSRQGLKVSYGKVWWYLKDYASRNQYHTKNETFIIIQKTTLKPKGACNNKKSLKVLFNNFENYLVGSTILYALQSFLA